MLVVSQMKIRRCCFYGQKLPKSGEEGEVSQMLTIAGEGGEVVSQMLTIADGGSIPDNCYGHHGRCPCKNILSGVKFSRLNTKTAYI